MKRDSKIIVLPLIVTSILLMNGCNGRKWLSGNPAKSDSLFLGLYLGMERQSFFDTCASLNQQAVITNGPTKHSVEYIIKDELPDAVYMRFYPTFHNDRVYEMPVTFAYEGWAPWNRQFWSNELFPRMLTIFKKWYGPDFKEINHPTMGKIYYKMDGKRRINLFIRDEQFVQAVFTDLDVEKQLKDAGVENPINQNGRLAIYFPRSCTG